jgi:hypothetical protein
MQSQEEILLVTEYWKRHYAPEGYLDTLETASLMANEVHRRGHSVATFENLTEAANALGDKVIAPKLPAQSVEPVVQKTTWKAPERRGNVADVNDERTRFAEAVGDINSVVFTRIQDEARDEFNKICNSYQTYTPMGKADHSQTSERRLLLRGIKIVDKRRNAKGQEVVLYTAMLARANEMLREFEKEDSNRNQQRW